MIEAALKIAAGLFVAYAGVVALAFAFQRGLQYFPDRVQPSPATAGVPEMAVVETRAADGVRLVGWYRAALGQSPTIVYFHGNGGNIADRAATVRPWLDRGIGVVLFNMRGYGASEGSPSEAGWFADGAAALGFAQAQGVAPERIVLFGESMGSGVAVKVATEVDIAALILQAPLTSAVDIAAHHYRFLPVRWLMKDRYESIARIGALRAPLLIVHGEADDIVPVGSGRALLAAAPEPKQGVFIAGAGHNDVPFKGGTEAALRFLVARFPLSR
ncbi:MAG: alpha/beta hydrolase [Alphaproteobacteria bacterium]|nr:alpha/beta hydrolase [Alphaproteobacteria bacterium]